MFAYFSQLTDIFFADLPRVRLDRVRRPMKPAPTLREVPEENENFCESQQQQQMEQLELNTTLGSTLGECIYT